MILFILVVILSYLAGSFPTAIVAGKLILRDDIRKHGSGNAGATNVFRVMGWKAALIVVLVDIGKGTAAVLLISGLAAGGPVDMVMVRLAAGLAAIAGHIWTVFAGFRGGKGVGTAFGVLVALMPLPSLITMAVWILLVLTVRIVSVASLSAGVIFPLVLILQKIFFDPQIPAAYVITSVCLGCLIWITHRSNISRLIRGEENRFGKKNRSKQNLEAG